MVLPSFRTILWWAAIAFVAWWVIAQPGRADLAIHHAGALLSHAADGLLQFVSGL